MAAGLGFKTFNTGDVLTAGDTNGYLMQGVWVFASAAARSSAVTSPQEGNVSFLKDTNSLEIYDGASWVAYGSGDITGVTAGTGISGGGTSGSVTITNSMATEISAAGDIIVGTGSGTFDNLPIGTTGQVLTADTTVSPYKVKWATAAAGGGKVLQVVQGVITTKTTITSTSYTDTNITATITPTLNTSKILILVSAPVYINKTSTGTYINSKAKLVRGSTDILIYPYVNQVEGASASSLSMISSLNMVYLDSPATTSATTYKVQAAFGTGNSVIYQIDDSPQAGTSTITLMEIGA